MSILFRTGVEMESQTAKDRIQAPSYAESVTVNTAVPQTAVLQVFKSGVRVINRLQLRTLINISELRARSRNNLF